MFTPSQSDALPNNPFNMGPAPNTNNSNNSNINPNPTSIGSNPFTIETTEQSVMNTKPVTTNSNTNIVGDQMSPNLQGGVHMQNQGGFGPTPSNPGFGPTSGSGFNPQGGGFNPQGTQPQGGGFNPQGTQPQGGGFNPQGTQPGSSPFSQPGNNVQSHTPNFQNNVGGGQQTPRYIIVDFFWWINKNIINQKPTQQGEASILTVGFNASFNNLRLSFYGSDQSTFTPSSITMSNAPKLANCNIHSEQAMELLVNKGSGKTIYSFERVIKSGNWTPNQSQITWNPDNIAIQTTDNQGTTYRYVCQEDQIYGFEKALEFMTNGQAWASSLQAIMNR